MNPTPPAPLIFLGKNLKNKERVTQNFSMCHSELQ